AGPNHDRRSLKSPTTERNGTGTRCPLDVPRSRVARSGIDTVPVASGTPAEGAPAMSPLPNILLVHGAWADGSSWSGVIEGLQAEGYKVTAPQFPLSSLADDVARLRS